MGTNKKSEEIISFYLIFVHLGTFIVMWLGGNVHVWLGCTKRRSPGIGTALHWQPLNVHIFGIDPYLPATVYMAWHDVQILLKFTCYYPNQYNT